MARMNNLSARLISNEWLVQHGHKPISASETYEAFATKLREVTAPKSVQVTFPIRADACRYIRIMAAEIKAGSR